MSTFASSNSVSDSLERCRQAFRTIVEGQSATVAEEEDYLEKASRFEKVEPMEDDDAVFIDAEKEPDVNLEEISSAIGVVSGKRADAGLTAVTVSDHYEVLLDDGKKEYCFEFSCPDSAEPIPDFVSDVEKVLGDEYEFEFKQAVNDGGPVKFTYSAVKKDQIGESAEFKPYSQEHKRLRKPKQIKKSAQFVRNNRLMKRLFRRRYFAKKKLLFGTK